MNTAQRFAIAIIAAVSFLVGAAAMGAIVVANTAATMPATVEEDQPGWNCSTMGNRVCGPTRLALATSGDAVAVDANGILATFPANTVTYAPPVDAVTGYLDGLTPCPNAVPDAATVLADNANAVNVGLGDDEATRAALVAHEGTCLVTLTVVVAY